MSIDENQRIVNIKASAAHIDSSKPTNTGKILSLNSIHLNYTERNEIFMLKTSRNRAFVGELMSLNHEIHPHKMRNV